MNQGYVRGSLLIALLACAVGGAAAGCGTTASVDGEGGAAGPQFGADASPSKEAGPQVAREFCAGSGGIVLPGTTQCTGDLAKKLFRFGICSCTGVTVNGETRTRSFSSARARG